jgi:UDP-N-acetylglucosamine 4,6-dehydratase/5-epimerase
MINTNFNKKTILVTGGSGSWGNELVSQLLKSFHPKEIRIYSRGELKQVEMKRKFQNNKIKYYIGDVRDKNRLLMCTKNVDYIFHLAALKHVPVCEENPWESVQTNIIGTQNIIEVSIENQVKKVIDVSTDKAVDPFNLYGVTKACGEKLMIAANLLSTKTKFVCVRGGNVMGTRGSVIPLFNEQLVKLNQITLTDERMTRFLMTVEEAIKLVIHTAITSNGGEVFVMKMPACKITDLANVMIKHLGNKNTRIKIIGIRPGEKITEILVSKYEMPRTIETDKYFIILPQIKLISTEKYYSKHNILQFKHDEFNSSNTHQLTLKEIEKLLMTDSWFNHKIKKENLSYLERLGKKDLINFVKIEGWMK